MKLLVELVNHENVYCMSFVNRKVRHSLFERLKQLSILIYIYIALIVIDFINLFNICQHF